MVDANGEPIVNKIKSGRPVTLKFEVFDEKRVELTRTGTDVISSFKSASISCGTLADNSADAIKSQPTRDPYERRLFRFFEKDGN